MRGWLIHRDAGSMPTSGVYDAGGVVTLAGMSFVIEQPRTTDVPTSTATTALPSEAPRPHLDDETAKSLRVWNLAAGVFHLMSSVIFLVIMTDFKLPITASFPTQDPALLQGTSPPTEILFTPTFGYGVAAFSLLSAFFHLLVGTVANRSYNNAIANKQNPFRWIEYAFSSTLMIVLITMLLGAYDIGALVGVAGANVSMILFGWMMERQSRPGENVDWYPFIFGCIAGIVPWIVIAIYFQGGLGNADEAVPPWVWGILFSVFALFNCFAINQFLQYKQVGKWRSYLFGERGYIVLSFVAKTVLVWQIYFGTVR